tara:strand:+ start:2279 stop:2479 length:201 start_codon:yes stop_codon:yes gene_type:complete
MEQLELFTTFNNEFVYLNQTIIDTNYYYQICEHENDLADEVDYLQQELEYFTELENSCQCFNGGNS